MRSCLLAGEETILCFLSIVLAVSAEAAENVSLTESALHALIRVPYIACYSTDRATS